MTEQPDPDFVQSLARGLAVIRAFDARHPRLNLSDISRRADISPAAARRFLRTLVTLGYVRQEGREFSLTPRVLELGFSYLSALSLPEVVQPHLEILSQEVDESVSAAVIDGTDIVYVARVSPRRIMTVGITIGTRFPAHVTSMGRVLLAAMPAHGRERVLAGIDQRRFTEKTVTDSKQLANELERVSVNGWALVNGELEPGLCSVAVPLRGADGTTAAAINISTSTTRHTPEWVEREFVPRLQVAAQAIETDLRHVR